MKKILTILLLTLSIYTFGQNNFNWYKQTTYTGSGTDTYTATITSLPVVNDQVISVNFANPNTSTTPTIAITGATITSAKTIQSQGVAVAAGQVKGIVNLKYDGTYWQLLGAGGSTGVGGNFFPNYIRSNAQFRSIATGNYNDPAIWQILGVNGTWYSGSGYYPAAGNVITISAGNTVTLQQNEACASAIVLGTLNQNGYNLAGFNNPLLIIFTGESNAGGLALNSSALSSELLANANIKILNNTTLTSIDNLQIGVNNIIGHTGITCCTTHGMELQLMNYVSAGNFKSPVYLAKTAQGGTTIANWDVGAIFSGTNSWQVFQDRLNAILSLIPSGDLANLKIWVWYSQGINDNYMNDGFASITWKNKTRDHFDKIRTFLGKNVPIIMTKFSSTFDLSSNYLNDDIEKVASYEPNVFTITTNDITPAIGSIHWDYTQFKTQIVPRMLAAQNGATPNWSAPFLASFSPTSATAGTSVVLTGKFFTGATSVNFGYGSTPVSASFTINSDTQITATVPVGITTGLITVTTPSGTVSRDGFLSTDATSSVINWSTFSNASFSTPFIISNGTNPSGGLASQVIDATKYFEVIVDMDGTNDTGTVFSLDLSNSTSTGSFTWGGNYASALPSVYNNGGNIFMGDNVTNFYTGIAAIPSGSFPIKIKYTKDRNNINITYSTNGGTSWINFYVKRDILIGVTNIYMRTVFAIAGSYKIKGVYKTATN